MNPLDWKREHQIAGVSFCLAGALSALVYCWLDSPFYRICHVPAGFANCSEMLGLWLQHPSQYWVLMLLGAVVPGLIFYGLKLIRAP
jgi:hypothetical protein